MKRADDPRHKKRKQAVRQLFAYSFLEHNNLTKLSKQAIEYRPRSDSLIQTAATEWPIEKINKVDLAVLRIAISELIKGKVPAKVVIDEAVELAKEYGSESSPSFINGVLGTTLENLKSQRKNEK